MKNIARLIIVAFIFCSTNALAIDKSWNYSIGLSVKLLSLNVYEKGKTEPEGILTDGYSIVPELGIDRNIAYLFDSNWGYKYAINFGRFEMATQKVKLEDVDLNTSAKGYYLYAMPVGLYDFLKDKKDSSLLVGFGIGIGYLNARGNIILTESIPQSRHNFSLSELTYSYGLLFEYQINNWSYNIKLYGPEVSDSSYEYNLFDFGMTIRRKFSF